MSFAAHLPFPSPATALPPQPQVSSTSPVSTPTPASRGCCENGRPVLTDPTTGQSVCSCQYSSALLGYSRLPGLPGSLFSPPSSYPSAPGAPPPPPPAGYAGVTTLGSEGSAFYSPLTGGANNLRDSTEAWRSLTQSSLYDTAPIGFYPYGGYGGLDLNARRKNATRESTNTLKAWLHEHIKNPYPTKGEKIMLAIITKMTLTQVSTWFANARRRLKKENKMTWSPRNRSEDGDDDDDDDDAGAGDDKSGGDGQDKEKRLNNEGDEIDVDSPSKCARTKTNGPSTGSDSVSPAPSLGEDSRSRLSPHSGGRSSESGYRLDAGHTHPSSDLDSDQQKPKIWSVTDFLHQGSNAASKSASSGPEPSSCKETGMKMDTMRCVPTSAEAAAVDLTGRTMGSVTAVAAAAAHAHAAALSAQRGTGFFPPMASLSPAAQQLTSYQTALASYAAHSSYTPYAGLSSVEMNKLVMKPTATRFSPYVSPKPAGLESPFSPPRDFSVLREGE